MDCYNSIGYTVFKYKVFNHRQKNIKKTTIWSESVCYNYRLIVHRLLYLQNDLLVSGQGTDGL